MIGQSPPSASPGILTKLELTGDATISTGGQAYWAIYNPTPGDPTTGYIKGNGYTLTTASSGTIYLTNLGDTGLGDIIANSGLAIQGSTGLGIASNTLTLNTLSALTLLDTGSYGVISKNFDLKSSSNIVSISSGSGGNFIAGNTLLAPACIIAT